jgi:catechol 2,3-dioxygenase-like lactoylglutathione lyase family enzyme
MFSARFHSEVIMPRPASLILVLLGSVAWSAAPVSAQSETMMYDHVHLAVPEPATAAAWYSRHFGGEPVDGRDERTLIGVTRFIFRQEANARPSEGGAVDHLGFSVPDLDAKLRELAADGATITTPRREVEGLFPISFVVDPWGVRLEIIEEPQHLGFHHIHLRTPDVEGTMQAYLNLFGGVRTPMRGSRDAILYPGNVWLMFTNGEGFPTAGSAIDHLGWRALDLQPKLEEMRGKGATVTRGPNDLTFENGTIHIYFIEGPRDVTIEIVQRAPNMR